MIIISKKMNISLKSEKIPQKYAINHILQQK